MCKSTAEGGKRCAAATRPAYEAALAQVSAASTEGERNDIRAQTMPAVANHASTRKGATEVAAVREQAARDGDAAQQWWLQHCEGKGAQQREVDELIERKIRERAEEQSAAVTRPAYEAALKQVAGAPTEGERNDIRTETMAAVVDHATTKRGANEIANLREQATRDGDVAQQYWLQHCENKGKEQRDRDALLARHQSEHAEA